MTSDVSYHDILFNKNMFKVDGEPVNGGIQESNYIKIDDLSKNNIVDVQVALSLQSNQENERRETDFVVLQTPFSKSYKYSVLSQNIISRRPYKSLHNFQNEILPNQCVLELFDAYHYFKNLARG